MPQRSSPFNWQHHDRFHRPEMDVSDDRRSMFSKFIFLTCFFTRRRSISKRFAWRVPFPKLDCFSKNAWKGGKRQHRTEYRSSTFGWWENVFGSSLSDPHGMGTIEKERRNSPEILRLRQHPDFTWRDSRRISSIRSSLSRPAHPYPLKTEEKKATVRCGRTLGRFPFFWVAGPLSSPWVTRDGGEREKKKWRGALPIPGKNACDERCVPEKRALLKRKRRGDGSD